jgi:hypothetical protein
MLTIASGGSVSFSNPAGGDFHNVAFEGAQPSSCTGLPPGPRKDWQGECTFADAGTYSFMCQLHPEMTGTVIVKAPTPTPTPDPTPTPNADSTPDPTTPPTSTQSAQPQATLTVKARGQAARNPRQGHRERGTGGVAARGNRHVGTHAGRPLGE